MTKTVHVRELVAWDLDDFSYRPASQTTKCLAAARQIEAQPAIEAANPILTELSNSLATAFATHATRPDLAEEMSELPWSLGVVDLRYLQAFQRRLSLAQSLQAPTLDDWPALIDFSFGQPRPLHYQLSSEHQAGIITLTTQDPNLHVRLSENPEIPLIVHGGSPFLEVARYRNHWFLRDGYHRAYALLRQNVFAVPAVILEVDTLTDLGADQPRFFPEHVLFSARPPLVHDFLDDQLTIDYERPTLTKTIRLTMEESFAPESN